MAVPSPAFSQDASPGLRKIAYHEAGHAVLYWNLGFGVRQVRLDAVNDCGHAQPQRNPKDRFSRIARAVACVGGLAAHSFLGPRLEWEDLCRSRTDVWRALALFLPPGELTEGEQLEVAIRLTGRVAGLLGAPELHSQIKSLVPPLLETGYLFEFQVEKRLRGLSGSPAARRRCREFVSQLVQERAELVQRAKGAYPDFQWPPGWTS